METLIEMKRRHKRERVGLIMLAIQSAGSVIGAARMLGADRGGIYRDLREAGIILSEGGRSAPAQ